MEGSGEEDGKTQTVAGGKKLERSDAENPLRAGAASGALGWTPCAASSGPNYSFRRACERRAQGVERRRGRTPRGLRVSGAPAIFSLRPEHGA